MAFAILFIEAHPAPSILNEVFHPHHHDTADPRKGNPSAHQLQFLPKATSRPTIPNLFCEMLVKAFAISVCCNATAGETDINSRIGRTRATFRELFAQPFKHYVTEIIVYEQFEAFRKLRIAAVEDPERNTARIQIALHSATRSVLSRPL